MCQVTYELPSLDIFGNNHPSRSEAAILGYRFITRVCRVLTHSHIGIEFEYSWKCFSVLAARLNVNKLSRRSLVNTNEGDFRPNP